MVLWFCGFLLKRSEQNKRRKDKSRGETRNERVEINEKGDKSNIC